MKKYNMLLIYRKLQNFISEMKDGLDTYIAQGGKNVSGGQKQRLSIARALIRKPEIYIFDDSFQLSIQKQMLK